MGRAIRGSNTFFNFGGSSAGSLTAVSLNTATAPTFGANSTFNWLTGTEMTMTLSDLSAADWAETDWDANRLLFNGQSKTALGGLTWADASNPSVGLGGGSYWDYNSGTQTLSVVAVPEPSSLALVGLAGAGFVILRRMRKRGRKS